MSLASSVSEKVPGLGRRSAIAPVTPAHRIGGLEVRLARPDEVAQALELRHRVFCAELGADIGGLAPNLEQDRYDAVCDHLVVLDHEASGRPVVGTYRLLREEVADGGSGFYSSGEYDLAPLKPLGRSGGTGRQLLELGRSCVAPSYRTHATITLLWRAIASYLDLHDIGLIFGCASFPGVDPQAHRHALGYLHQHHRAPPQLRVSARPEHYVEMAGGPAPADAARRLPPLIAAYLRVGAVVGDGAYVDHVFNTVDVFMLMPVKHIIDRYRYKFGLLSAEAASPHNMEGTDEHLA